MLCVAITIFSSLEQKLIDSFGCCAVLVDSSPSQKRKMRSQDPTDSEAELFPTHVAKELKRFHESRYVHFGSLVKLKLSLKM